MSRHRQSTGIPKKLAQGLDLRPGSCKCSPILMILTAFGVGLTANVSLEPKFWNGDDTRLGIGKAHAFPKFWLKD